jgi:cell wall-associated NlpC family hydrolase
MQAALVGTPIRAGAALRRGDLVFWPGHVAIVRDPDTLIHASGYHMAVVIEPVRAALARIGPMIARRRP